METQGLPGGGGPASREPGHSIQAGGRVLRAVHRQSTNLILFGGWGMGGHSNVRFCYEEQTQTHLSDAKVLGIIHGIKTA